MTNFDEPINRKTYPTMKWHTPSLREHFGNEDVLPFWIADMDFPAPDIVIENLQQRVAHGIYGYEYRKDNYFDALTNWYKKRHGWTIDTNHIEFCPGVLSAISILINQQSNEGDGVIVQPPVFFEFRSLIRSNKREMIKNPLKLVDGEYQMDFDDLAETVANPHNKILILCNPHNPVGRVWTRDELTQLADICQQHDVLVISDEIHGDIVYPPHHYTPFTSLSDSIAQASVTCISPAKTFNLAGMIDAMAVISNDEMRHQFHDFAHRYQINKTNVFSTLAIETAYTHGETWLDALLDYLQANITFLRNYLQAHLPQVKLIEPEGTYLVWLDFRALGLDAKALGQFLAQDAGLALNIGHWFGREGAGFARMNIATPRQNLEEALLRLSRAIQQ